MRLLTACSALLLSVGISASASILQDPEILIDSGGDAIPISTGINQVQPTGATTVTYDFVNDTSNIVTSFMFQTMIHTGLDPGLVSSSFSCQDPGGYFIHCTVNYNPGSGNLLYSYFGVNPTDGDEFTGNDPENGEQEGIPPARPECPTCGHFTITLNGWVSDATSNNVHLYAGLPNLDNSFTTTPEPSAALAIGSGLLLLALFWRLRRRQPVR